MQVVQLKESSRRYPSQDGYAYKSLLIASTKQRNIITTLSIMTSNTMRDNTGTKLDKWTTNRRSLKTNHYHQTGRARSVFIVHNLKLVNPFSMGQGGLNTMCRNGVAC